MTGLGIVSALGIGEEEVWRSLIEGASALRPSPASARGIRVPGRAGAIGDAAGRIEDIVDPRYLRRLSSISRHSLCAAVLAVRRAAPGSGAERPRELFRGDAESLDREGAAVLLGTVYGSSAYHFEYYERLFRNGLKDASPLLFSESVTNAAPGHVSIYLGLCGASLAVVGGEEAGLSAIADGADRIRLGDAAAALAGGAEEYCDFLHAALARRGIVSGEPGMPFGGSERVSFLGEGAALLFLEPAPVARARGAEVLAELAGTGFARISGGEDPALAVEAAIRAALLEAGIEARVGEEDVGLVVSGASGGPGDRIEAAGLERALGTRAAAEGRRVLVTAPKAALGEAFAFTSAVQALVAVKAIATGVVPPTPGQGPAPLLPAGFDLSRTPVEGGIRAALAVSVNLGGSAVALIFVAP